MNEGSVRFGSTGTWQHHVNSGRLLAKDVVRLAVDRKAFLLVTRFAVHLRVIKYARANEGRSRLDPDKTSPWF